MDAGERSPEAMPDRLKLGILLGLIIVAVFSFGLSAGAAPEQEDEVAAAQRRLAEMRMEAGSAYEAHDNAVFQLNELDEEIVAVSRELGAAEGDLAEAQGRLEERAAQMYKSGSVGFVDVLVGAQDFSDFANRLDLLMQLLAQDRAEFESVREARDRIARRKNELEAAREQREAAIGEADNQIDRAARLETEAQAYLDSLNAELREAMEAEQGRAAQRARDRGKEIQAEIAKAEPEAVRAASVPTEPAPAEENDVEPAPAEENVEPAPAGKNVEPAPVPDEENDVEPAPAEKKAQAPPPAEKKAQAPPPAEEDAKAPVVRNLAARQAAADRAAERAAAERYAAEKAAAAEKARLAAERAEAAEQARLREEARTAQRRAELAKERAAAQAAAEEEAKRQAKQQAAAQAAAEEEAERRARRQAAAEEEAATEERHSNDPGGQQPAGGAEDDQYEGGAGENQYAGPGGGSPSGGNAGAGGSTASGSAVVAEATTYMGVPYALDSCSRDIAVDCSCFTMLVYQAFGISLVDSPAAQFGSGSPVSGAPMAGDLVFWNEDGSGITHVGIATGNGTTIHASAFAGYVTETPIDSIPGYVGARRLL
jgi:peptidoglycan hydrolase CwlO-like protein